MDWALIPPGRFLMGGIEDDKFVTSSELPRHEVTIPRAFFISVHPVTNSQWNESMKSTPSANLPAVSISCAEAEHFCRNLTESTGLLHRLPSEAEWEYVCRAGSTAVFPQGASISHTDANFLYDESGRRVGPGAVSPVGSYPANAFGVTDLSGNVCEWTADSWHPGFFGAPINGSAWTEGYAAARRVIRGGAWDHLPRALRASWRDWAPRSSRWDNLGFRIVREEQMA